MKRIFFLLIVSLIFLLLISSCEQQKRYQSKEFFYRSYGDFDSIRFPLIKPYETIKISDEFGWEIALINLPNYGSILNIEKISIENNIIMVFSNTDSYQGDINNNDRKILKWFVIIPEENIEEGFYFKEDFLKYLSDHKMEKPKWFSPNSIYDQFVKTGCLYWIPDCQIETLGK
jgi:hypothetical protein